VEEASIEVFEIDSHRNHHPKSPLMIHRESCNNDLGLNRLHLNRLPISRRHLHLPLNLNLIFQRSLHSFGHGYCRNQTKIKSSLNYLSKSQSIHQIRLLIKTQNLRLLPSSVILLTRLRIHCYIFLISLFHHSFCIPMVRAIQIQIYRDYVSRDQDT